jgi:hypothetical protein
VAVWWNRRRGDGQINGDRIQSHAQWSIGTNRLNAFAAPCYDIARTPDALSQSTLVINRSYDTVSASAKFLSILS